MTGLIWITLIAWMQTAPAPITDEVARFAAASTNEERFDALTATLKARKIDFTVEPFTIPQAKGAEPRTEGRNVVVTIGEGNRDIVIGAHYDAVRLPNGALSKGAVDNAASSAILVRLAETLKTEKLRSRVRVVWFDMEEIGLIGSQQYLQKHSSDSIAAMVNFDINAYGKSVLYGPSERADNVALRREFLQTCAAENTTCVAFPQMPPGDDRSFVNAKIPTISVGVVPAVEAHQVWLMMNAGPNSGLAQGTVPSIFRTIHTAEDTVGKVDEETMGMMLRFALRLVRSVANQ